MQECTTCHGHHDVASVDDPVAEGWNGTVCHTCHDPKSTDDPAAEVADTIGRHLNELRGEISEAEALLVRARGEGVVTVKEQIYLNEARHTLIMAGPVSHTASAYRMEVLVQKGKGTVDRVRDAIDVKMRRVRDRRFVAVLIFGAIVVIVVLLQVKRRSLQRVTWEAETPVADEPVPPRDGPGGVRPQPDGAAR
jgi:hypothetical protein